MFLVQRYAGRQGQGSGEERAPKRLSAQGVFKAPGILTTPPNPTTTSPHARIGITIHHTLIHKFVIEKRFKRKQKTVLLSHVTVMHTQVQRR